MNDIVSPSTLALAKCLSIGASERPIPWVEKWSRLLEQHSSNAKGLPTFL